MANANLIQLYSDDARTQAAYPICHEDGIFDDAGNNVIANLKSDLNQKITTLPNLFNKDSSSNVAGYFAGTSITQDARYCLSHIITFKSGATYKWKKLAELGTNNRVAEYDESGNYIDWHAAVADSDSAYWNYTPSKDMLVRINVGYVSNKDTFMVCVKGSYPQNYIPFGNKVNDDVDLRDICIGYDGEVYESAGESVRNQIIKMHDSIVIDTKNLFNSRSLRNIEGYSLKDVRYNDAHYLMSHPIPVKKGVTYKWLKPIDDLGTNNTFEKVDENGNYLDWHSAGVDGDYYTFTPLNNEYIRLNVGKVEKAVSFIFAVASEYPNSYVPYGSRLIDDADSNPLYGKKAVFTGDSICAGAGDGGGYSKYIGANNSMTIQNIAVSGGTIVATQGHFNIGDSISSLNEDADYVILEGGVNDASLDTPLGTITLSYWREFDKTTFCGAFESMIKDTYERFPGKKIGYILVHKCTGNFASDIGNGSNGPHYDAVIKMCRKWGIPVLNLQEHVPPFAFFSSEYPQLRAIRDKYTHEGDGWHPNALGYMTYYVPRIEAWLKTL